MSESDPDIRAMLAAIQRRYGTHEAARRLSTTPRTIQRWETGERVPTRKAAAQIIELHAAMVVPRPIAPPQLAAPAPTEGTEDKDALAVCRATVARLERELDRLAGDVEASARERATVATALTAATRLLARLSGQLEVTHAAIIRSAAWRRILKNFEDVFARHPEAAKALQEFAQALHDGGEG